MGSFGRPKDLPPMKGTQSGTVIEGMAFQPLAMKFHAPFTTLTTACQAPLTVSATERAADLIPSHTARPAPDKIPHSPLRKSSSPCQRLCTQSTAAPAASEIHCQTAE